MTECIHGISLDNDCTQCELTADAEEQKQLENSSNILMSEFEIKVISLLQTILDNQIKTIELLSKELDTSAKENNASNTYCSGYTSISAADKNNCDCLSCRMRREREDKIKYTKRKVPIEVKERRYCVCHDVTYYTPHGSCHMCAEDTHKRKLGSFPDDDNMNGLD